MRSWWVIGLFGVSSALAGFGQAWGQLPGAAVKEAATPRLKMVPMILIKKDKLSGEDPHLPDVVKAQHVGTVLSGSYKVCIGTDGAISSVDTVSGIAGANESIIKAVRTWRYRPQRIPICFVQFFEFHIEPGTPQPPGQIKLNELPEAYVAFSQGRFQQAAELGQQAAMAGTAAVAVEAWRIVGMAACMTKNPVLASSANRSVATAAYSALLIEMCRRNGVIYRGGEFLIEH